MAEWRIEELDGDNPIVWIDEHTYFVAEHDPSMIVNAHNADCAAYRAELARVKAESLRVVVDGEACDWEMLEDSDKDGLFVVDGKLYCRDRGTRNKIVDVSTGEAIHIYDEDGVQPVRLERWEATE